MVRNIKSNDNFGVWVQGPVPPTDTPAVVFSESARGWVPGTVSLYGLEVVLAAESWRLTFLSHGNSRSYLMPFSESHFYLNLPCMFFIHHWRYWLIQKVWILLFLLSAYYVSATRPDSENATRDMTLRGLNSLSFQVCCFVNKYLWVYCRGEKHFLYSSTHLRLSSWSLIN